MCAPRSAMVDGFSAANANFRIAIVVAAGEETERVARRMARIRAVGVRFADLMAELVANRRARVATAWVGAANAIGVQVVAIGAWWSSKLGRRFANPIRLGGGVGAICATVCAAVCTVAIAHRCTAARSRMPARSNPDQREGSSPHWGAPIQSNNRALARSSRLSDWRTASRPSGPGEQGSSRRTATRSKPLSVRAASERQPQ